MTNLDKQINDLLPGRTLKLTPQTWVERSGDGKTLRFVRQDGNTSTVFATRKF